MAGKEPTIRVELSGDAASFVLAGDWLLAATRPSVDDPDLAAALRDHEGHIGTEVLATRLVVSQGSQERDGADIDGLRLRWHMDKADA